MCVGISVDHANGIFHGLNLITKRITYTRDVVWLGKCYKSWSKTKMPLNDQDKNDNNEDFADNIATINQEEKVSVREPLHTRL